MKKLPFIFVLLALCAISRPSWGAIAYVDSTECCEASGTVSRIDLSAASQVAGNAGVMVVSIDRTNSPTGTVLAVTDSSGSYWYFKDVATNTGNTRAEIWVSDYVLGAAVTTQATLSGNIFATGSVAYYSGVAVFGLTATATGSSTAPSVSITTQDTDNYIAGGLTFRTGAGASWSAATGTIRQSYDGANSASAARAQVDNTSASPASTTVSATLGSSQDWAAVAIELRSITPVGCNIAMNVASSAFLLNNATDHIRRNTATGCPAGSAVQQNLTLMGVGN